MTTPDALPADNKAAASGIGRRPGLMAWALLMPLLLWLLLLVIVPTAIMIVFSFCQRDEAGLGTVVYDFAFDNYTRLLDLRQAMQLFWSIAAGTVAAIGVLVVWRKIERPAASAVVIGFLAVFWTVLNVFVFKSHGDTDAGQWLKIAVLSVNYAAASTAICVALGYPVAYFIGKAHERWRNLLLMLVMIPFWTSFLVRTYAWVNILRDEGLLNSLLIHLKLITEPLGLYPSQTGVMIGLVYTYLPFMILPIYTSVERLDNALVEAAFDLGASPLRAFRGVILPLTRPGIIAGVVLVFVPAVGMFAVNDILGGRHQMLIGNVIERQFMYSHDAPFGSALGMTLLLLFVITYALSMRRREVAN
ncbi:MAG: transporter permease [Phycisphaerales bacterium]|nr:transporter permease [Phycisphaerales bacterium]